MDLKRFIFGIFWFILFINLYYLIIASVLWVRSSPTNPGEISPEAIRAAVEIFVRDYGNLSLLGPFLLAAVGTAAGFLPGTRRPVRPNLSGEVEAPRELLPDRTYPSAEQALGLVFLLVTLQFGFSIAGGSLFELLGRKGLGAESQTALAAPLLACAVAILFVFRTTGKSAASTIESRPIPWLLPIPALLLIAGLTILSSETDNILRSWFPPPEIPPTYGVAPGAGGLYSFLLVVLGTPLLEEFMFRGVIQGGLSRNYSFRRSILLSSFFFAFVHLNPYQLLPALGMGLVLGWIYYFSRNIWICVLLHGFVNCASWYIASGGVSVTIPGFTVDPRNPLQHSFQPIWFDLIGLGLLTTGLYWTARVLNGLEPARTELAITPPQ